MKGEVSMIGFKIPSPQPLARGAGEGLHLMVLPGYIETQWLSLARVQWEQGLLSDTPTPLPWRGVGAQVGGSSAIARRNPRFCRLPLARVQWERGSGVRERCILKTYP